MVLEFWRNQPPNKDLELPDLRMKLIILLKLAIMGRSADIVAIDRNMVNWNDTQFELKLFQRKGDATLSWSDGQKFPFLPAEDEKICVGRTLVEFCSRTDGERSKNRKGEFHPKNLFLHIDDPRKTLSTQRVAKLTLEALDKAGIDIQKYKSHSVRGAAANWAIDKGATVDEVMKWGCWKSFTVFNKFYDCSISKRDMISTTFK